MKRSTNRTLTTHAGSLPRPEDLMELYREDAPDSKLLPRLQSAITDVVRRQADIGIDIVNDGEFGKAMRRAVDFAAWWSYVYDRLAGFEIRKENAKMGERCIRSAARSARNSPNSMRRTAAWAVPALLRYSGSSAPGRSSTSGSKRSAAISIF